MVQKNKDQKNIKDKVDKDDKIKKNIVEVLNDILKKEIIIDNVVDQGIIGGVVIEIGSYVIDSSFENVLRRIKLSTNDI